MDFPERLAKLERGERIIVAVQQRRIDFSTVEVPEVEVRSSRTVAQCADTLQLLRFLEALPAQRMSGFAWWALDRMEVCSSCGRGFNTGKPHWALAVTIEAAGRSGEGLIACWYPERFCTACRPPDGDLAIWPARH